MSLSGERFQKHYLPLTANAPTWPSSFEPSLYMLILAEYFSLKLFAFVKNYDVPVPVHGGLSEMKSISIGYNWMPEFSNAAFMQMPYGGIILGYNWNRFP